MSQISNCAASEGDKKLIDEIFPTNCYGVTTRNNSKISLPEYTSHFDRNAVNLEWRNITLKTKNGMIILKGLSGSTNSGELTAIMGPSGAGKTSLVNVLSGFIQKGITGEILVNGARREMSSFQKLTSYILQDDNVLPRFTVRELITFASRLKIPGIFSEKDRQRAVDDCLYCLGLVSQQNQYANTLSGGQRKRLCIAQEIVNNPPLIFLDEPTSGLDSSSSYQCIHLLKTLAEGGRNIICTIHQPSSRIYEIFDKLYMISDGDCIYRGPTNDLVPYLTSHGLRCPKYHSPTDFLTDIAIGLYGESNQKLKASIKSEDKDNNGWCKIDMGLTYKVIRRNRISSTLSSLTKTIKEAAQESWKDIKNDQYATSSWNQFRVLFKRSFLDILKEPINLKLKLLGSVGTGLLLGSMFYGTGNDGTKVFNTAGLLFTLLVFIVITSKIPTVLTFPLQRAVFQREHFNSWYSTKMYYLATTAAQMPFQIVCPGISCGLIYWLSGQPREMSRFCLFLLSGILISLNAESIGLMIGTVSNVQAGVDFATLLSGAVLPLSGSILPIHLIPVYFRWLSYILYCRYGLQCIFLTLYENRPSFECGEGTCFFRNPTKFVNHMQMDGDLNTYFSILIMFIVFFRICSFLMLQITFSRRYR